MYQIYRYLSLYPKDPAILKIWVRRTYVNGKLGEITHICPGFGNTVRHNGYLLTTGY